VGVRCVTTHRADGRRTRGAAAALAALALALAPAGCGGGGAADPPAVGEGWAVAVDDQAAAAYVTITAAEDDELTGARVAREVAARVEVVSPTGGGEDAPGHLGHLDPGGSLGGDHGHAVELPAGRPVALEPGGPYLALGPLAEPLAPADTFPVTLSFRDAPDVTVDVTVRPDGP
jgi:copper(I)-binding protein